METYSIQYNPVDGWSAAFPQVDSSHTLVLVFGPAIWDKCSSALSELIAHFPQSIVAGCSGYGAVLDGNLVDDTLAVNITRFTQTNLRLITFPVKQFADSFITGQALAQELKQATLKAVMVLSDGLRTNGAELSAGLNKILGNTASIIGGLAADSQQFKQTWVIANQLPQEQLACAIGFYGNAIQFRSIIRDGWSPFGPERKVTLASGNRLYTIDDRPILELYKHYLGDRANDFVKASLHFPLAIRPQGSPHTVIRTPIGIDEASKSLLFAGDIPENSTAQLMHGSMTTLLEGSYEASQQLALMTRHVQAEQMLLLTISCGARRAVMGEDAELELSAACSAFPEAIHQIGYYSFGELGPNNIKLENTKGSDYCATRDCSSCLATPTYGICELHNQTMTLTAIYEQAGL